MEDKKSKIYKFGRLSKETNEELEWIVIDENRKQMLLISVNSFGNDNAEFLENYLLSGEIAKHFSSEELKRIEEVRLLTKEEYEEYKDVVDLKAPYSYYLEKKADCGCMAYYEIVSRINQKSMTEVVDCFDDTFKIIAYFDSEGHFEKATYDEDKNFEETQWNYAIRPVLVINK